jgi:hypothetical protein
MESSLFNSNQRAKKYATSFWVAGISSTGHDIVICSTLDVPFIVASVNHMALLPWLACSPFMAGSNYSFSLRPSRRIQVRIPIFHIRFQVCPFRPFIPCINKYKSLLRWVMFLRPLAQPTQPATIQLRRL